MSEPKFAWRQKVVVTKGFYRGWVAKITSAKFPKWYRRRWSYKIEESHYTLWVNEDEIELLKEVSGE